VGRPSTSSGARCRWLGGSRKPRAPSASPRNKSCSRWSPDGCPPIWGWFCSLTASTEPPR
jgi:hypothetical protein